MDSEVPATVGSGAPFGSTVPMAPVFNAEICNPRSTAPAPMNALGAAILMRSHALVRAAGFDEMGLSGSDDAPTTISGCAST